MAIDTLILEEARETNKLLKKQIELLEKIYFVFSKYDEQYLKEMEGEGLNLTPEGK